MTNSSIYEVILETKDGKSYGLRHLENIWRGNELGIYTGYTKESHGVDASVEPYKDALANSYMDKIEQGFRSYTQQLFPRQLGSVMVDKDLQPHIDVRGAAREVESFSAGLADSILLCMRLALVDALFGEETPFLILDDPFVNLDDEHTRRALAMLQEMAETHQILYLVCNTGRV